MNSIDTQKELNQRSGAKKVSPVYMAFIYVGLGDKDRAIAALEEASRGRHGMLGLMQSEVIFDSVASDPRFVELWSRLAEAKSN